MIRLYQKNDEVGINKLFKAVFNKERSIEEWKWKFETLGAENPIIVVFEENGEIIGHAACIIYEDKIAERVDIMVHPSHQGKGIYKQIVLRMVEELESRQIHNVYGFPAEVAKAAFIKYGKATDLGNIALMLSPKLFPSKKQDWLPIKDADLEKLSTYQTSLNEIHVNRSAEFLKQRFALHPTRDYFVYESEGNGYAIVRFEGNKTHLLDVVGPNLKAVLKDIKKRINTRFLISWAVKDSHYYKALKGSLFFHIKSPMPLVVKQQHKDAKWHLTQADVDSF
ncbi:GNAT family N-acetyltransferase [Bacillus timonensis]|uniref:GNAT family N-acetyltransferase n=1 Tax=Bacillus timonensis TaxID=1033734 RepID=UPI000289D8DF|nr:GNAT family N-acetyltransferase [Bacillus timonensis]